MMHEELNQNRTENSSEAFIKSSLNIKAMEDKFAVRLGVRPTRVEIFSVRLKETLSPAMSAKDLIDQITQAALEVEFGSTFTLSKGFGKMVKTISGSIITNPDLRRQALAIASLYLSEKIKGKGKGV